MSAAVFQAGGALRPQAVYAERPADHELLSALLAGELATVLAPRQMGKSSLLVRTAARLRASGVVTAVLDLSTLGTSDREPDRWMLGLLDELAAELDLPDPVGAWLARADLPPVSRLLRYLRRVVIGDREGPVVIFLDEIDTVLGLDFSTDDLFAAIRASVNLRASDPGWERLRFCLLGVASPFELVRDPARTSFNVGRGVRLEDLTRVEAAAFAPALAPYGPSADALLDAIWSWTAGHPYMTQRICAALAEEGPSQEDAAPRVRRHVSRLFLEPGPLGDINLASASRSLLARDGGAGAALARYRRVWEGLAVPADERDPTTVWLLLSGMVARQRGSEPVTLKVRNRIFYEVFDRDWVEDHLGRRALIEAAGAWVARGRHEDELLRGAALASARRWAVGREDLAPDEVALLLASAERLRLEDEDRARRAALDRERRFEHARAEEAERHLGQQRRLVRWLLAAVGAMAVALAGAALFYARLIAAGEGLDAAERARAAVWRESAGLLPALPGHEREAVAMALLAAQDELQREGDVTPATLLTLSKATAFSSRTARLDLGDASATATIWTPDGALLVGDDRGRITRWDVERRAFDAVIQTGGGRVNHLAALPEGWAAVSADGRLRTYRWEGSPGPWWAAHEGEALFAAASPDGLRLATSGVDGAVRIWEIANGRLIAQLSGPEPVQWHPASLHTVAWSPDGATVASGAEDSQIYLWDSASGSLRGAFPTGFDQALVTRYSTDGETILFGTQDGWVARVRARDGSRLLAWRASARAVTGLVPGPGEDLLYTTAQDGGVRLWDSRSGGLVQSVTGAEGGLSAPALSPDGQQLAMAAAGQGVRIWLGHARQAEVTLRGHRDRILSACWLDADHLATASVDRTARIWARGGAEIVALEHPAAVTAVAPGPAGRLLTAAEDLVLRDWDPATRELLASIPLGWTASQILRTPDPQVVLAVTHAGPVLQVDLSTGGVHTALVARSRSEPGRYLADLSPDGQWLVAPAEAASFDAGLWAVTGGEPTRRLRGHAMPVRAARFSPDGRWIATGARDGQVRLWRADTGEAVGALAGHQSWVLSLSFSPDGAVLGTGSADGAAMLWDVTRGAPFARFEDAVDAATLGDPRHFVTSAELSPDGRWLLATGSGEAALIYPATAEGLVRSACRELSAEADPQRWGAICQEDGRKGGAPGPGSRASARDATP